MSIRTGFRIAAVWLRRWFAVAIVAVVFVFAGCGGSEQESASSDDPVIERRSRRRSRRPRSPPLPRTRDGLPLNAWQADAAYVGWVIWRDLGSRTKVRARTISRRDRGDVEAVARALLTHSDAYGDEELGSRRRPRNTSRRHTTDNDLARFDTRSSRSIEGGRAQPHPGLGGSELHELI